jgi:hypothetical protein
MDSLMDALTNVVAVLILVLILVQADVSQKVVQFLEDLAPATPEEVIASTKKVEDLDKKKLKIQNLLTEDAPSPEDIEAEKLQLALLEKDAKKNKKLLAEISELKKREEKALKERDNENKKTTEIQKEIARLKALLDDNPIVTIAPTEVSIPISRSIPKNAEIYHAIVIHDRVHFIDPFTPVELFEDAFKKNKIKKKWLVKRIKRQGTDRYIYNQTKIIDHFKGFDFKNSRQQKVKVAGHPYWTRLRLVIKPDLKNGGTALADINKMDSTYVKILKKLVNNSRAVILFHVHPNSFNTYLQARSLTDKAQISAGWEIHNMTQYVIILKDVEVKRLKDPPPPDPNAKPKPPGPPPIGPKLD